MAEDKVLHPNHYEVNGIQLKDIWASRLSFEQLKGLYLGNVQKYVLRAERKNGLEDYRKAQVYLDWLIKLIEEHESKETNEKE